MISKFFYIIIYMSTTGTIVWISTIILGQIFKFKLNSLLILLPFAFYVFPIKDFTTKLIDLDPSHDFIPSFKVVATIWIIGFIINITYIVLINAITQYKVRNMKPCYHPIALKTLKNVSEKLDVKKEIKLYESSSICNVRLYGVINQCIIVAPQILDKLDSEKLEMVFAHELCHLKNLDLHTRWLVRILCCIHWFNPFVWMSNISHELHCEMRCDDQVVDFLKNNNGNQRKKYALLIIELLEENKNQKRIPLSAGITPYINLKVRLERIIGFNSEMNKKIISAVTSVIISIAVWTIVRFSIGYFY